MTRTLIALVVWFWVGVAQGQAVPLVYQGQEGVWLPLGEAREAVACLIDRDSFTARIRLLEESLSIADTQVAALRLGIEQAEARVTEALTRVGAAEAERDAWYRSPFLWGALGLVLGAGVAIAAILGAGA